MPTLDREAAINLLNDLRDKCYATAKDKGWYDRGEPSTPERIALMHSELSEALEDFRVGDVRLAIDNNGKPVGMPSEFADVIIRIFDFCGRHSIDIGEAVVTKMDYNDTRSYRHGNKNA